MKTLESDIQQFPARRKCIRDILSTEYLFRYNYPPHWSDLKHDFMLYILVCFGSVLLLERYLDCHTLTPKAGTNPLVYAARFSKAHHTRILLSRGARVNEFGYAAGYWTSQYLPLEVAIEQKAVELVDLLLAAESRVPEQLFQTCVSPAQAVPLRIIRSLLRTDEFAEWAINYWNKQLLPVLHYVLSRGYVEEEQDDLVNTPLDIAVANGHVFTAEYLISITYTCTHILAVARAWKNPARMMQMLIDKGADVHVCMSNGDSALHIAIRSHIARERDIPHESLSCTSTSHSQQLKVLEDAFVETAKILIDSGCDPAVCNSDGQIPLHIAVMDAHSSVAIVKYMLSLDIPLPPNILPSVLRAKPKQAELIKTLIDGGADVHACTSNGNNMLHIAIKNCLAIEHRSDLFQGGLVETVKILVDSGCNPAVCNSNGQTPLHIAVFNAHISIVEYMLSLDIPLPPDILLSALRASPKQAELIKVLVDTQEETLNLGRRPGDQFRYHRDVDRSTNVGPY
ncbi:hypothetical protein PAXINDRAFT_12156 [Paxillus involutus ATCC 200175]|uniref:Ankyrin n=1 Tax=Paxillus involutus ATCC 200175 TaxID=664439 RepID=A0A0C9THV8_PAXIN|nr:hypothetical protein PAXINDRAFT_12156 [Paxillus involutus ATCC 200175]